MKDPYSVLGVTPQDSDEKIKQTYKELAKKYHPDVYQESPLKDLAEEKMAEINGAYDEIVTSRKNASSRGGYSSGGGYSAGGYNWGYGYESTGEFSDIRRLIDGNQILEAQQRLESIPQSQRNAEWNYLMGHVSYTRGFLEDALQYIQRATQMDPSNMEYRAAYDMLNRNNSYGGMPMSGVGTCGPCGICSTLMCADCTCSTCRCCC